jgi:hypothetical protein
VRRFVLGLALIAPLPLSGQQAGGIQGQVVAGPTHAPIPGAVVDVAAAHLSATSDTAGRFALRDLSPGTYLLEIHAVGFTEAAWRLRVTEGHVVQHVFDLEPLLVKLPAVAVEGQKAEFGRRFADFERRRDRKMGYFLTRKDIDGLNASALTDVLATVRGVTLDCTGGTCIARMSRSARGCEPQYFIDGNESTAFFARNTPPHDILGLEIYRGPSELPAEFTGSTSGCGVIVIWTKSSP